MPATQGHPEISVVVPARNGAGSLPPLLRSLQAQTLEPGRYEVIVVDNASADDTSAVAAAHGARVVIEPVANRSRARNAGAAAARGRLLAFTDADCVADRRWLEALLAAAEQAPLVAGDVQLQTGPVPNRVERFELLWRFGQEHWVREQGWAATANLLVHAAAFRAIGGFDATWRHIGEDVDFCLRARLAGFDLAFCAAAIVSHEADSTLRPLLERCYRHGYSVNQMYYRHGLGYRAWREPSPALLGGRALRRFGHSPRAFSGSEWRAMARVARLGYAARIIGSAWAELTRAR